MKVYLLLFIPRYAFEQELVNLGVFSSVEILKELFYDTHDKTAMLYNLDNSNIETPIDNYYCYEEYILNEYTGE